MRISSTRLLGTDLANTIVAFYLGNLALSRAIGDFEFKKNATLSPEDQIITSNPDITKHKISEEDEFFVLACDGEFLSNFLRMTILMRFL